MSLLTKTIWAFQEGRWGLVLVGVGKLSWQVPQVVIRIIFPKQTAMLSITAMVGTIVLVFAWYTVDRFSRNPAVVWQDGGVVTALWFKTYLTIYCACLALYWPTGWLYQHLVKPASKRLLEAISEFEELDPKPKRKSGLKLLDADRTDAAITGDDGELVEISGLK